jgi:hypothetical protein
VRQHTRRRKDRKRRKAYHCGCCSILSWEQKKFDLFHEQYFSESLTGSRFSEYFLNPPPCDGGALCLSCGIFLCHDCIVALHKAIKKDHPNLQDPWLLATRETSCDGIIQIAVGHCCLLKTQKKELPSVTMLSPSGVAILAGANHYYQYDLSIGSTPLNCVDVFSLGAVGSNGPVTHAVFPVHVAVEIANKNLNIPRLDLTGTIISVCSPVLSNLPYGFNKTCYKIKVVIVKSTTLETPVLGKLIMYYINTVVDSNQSH